MGKTQQAAGGGLTAADRAKLIPENIRKGVVLFEGTAKEVAGRAVILEDKDYISKHGVTVTPGSLYIGPDHHNEAVSAISTPVFDISSYDYVTFMGCSASSSGPGSIRSFRCSVLKDGVTIAAVNEKDANINVSKITGAVQFKLTGYGTWEGGTGYTTYSISFKDVMLTRLNS